MRTEPALQKDFIDILCIGDLFMSKTLMGWALRKLDSMDLSPSQALGIAIRFRVRIWLDKCIKGVLLMPTAHLSLEYIQEMNPHQDPFITYTIMKAREALLTERHHVATTPLFIPVDDADRTYCDSDRHKKCVQATQAAWARLVAPRILDPNFPLNLLDPRTCHTFLRSLSFKGVNRACFNELCDRVEQHCMLTSVSAEIAEVTISGIAHYIGCNYVLERETDEEDVHQMDI
ncbi:hypothetical protein BKA70DRAFT_1433409 [Coprinopsis sp. MPI-PUGE-AT-0042]|nr:hypothetical protein BKA70DRAFT_1433409 [Coprinopsis sp. MPI-PUGE-AT-0042]